MKKIFVCIVILLFAGQNFLNAQDQPVESGYQKAIVAGGCFWCIESVFDQVNGVIKAVSGYTAGDPALSDYENVSSGASGHYEAVEITYDPQKISYDEILNIFWQDIDPTDDQGQFNDRGPQYRTAIFYFNEEQKSLAHASKASLEASGRFNKPIVTQILEAQPFYPAEEYHQDYSKKKPDHYKSYRAGSGREGFVRKMWKDKIQNEADQNEFKK